MDPAHPAAQPIDENTLLADWHAPAPPTVVCATRRLQQHLLQRYGEARAAAGQSVWTRPPCTTREDWLANAYDTAARTAAAQDRLLPRALGRAETDAAWRRIVERDLADSPLLDPKAARGAARAWALCCAHRISLPLAAGEDPDAAAFNRWAERFESLLAGLEAEAPERLPQRLIAASDDGLWQPPARIVLAGFDRLTPGLEALLARLEAAGCQLQTLRPPRNEPHTVALSAVDRAAELRLAAQRVRELAETDAEARIGVVVQDLGARRQAVQQAFDAALWPDRNPQDPPEHRPWNLSLGAPLSEQALVADALGWIDWAARGGSARPLDEAMHLLQSPYWPGAEASAAVVACDLHWRERRFESITLRSAAAALERRAEAQPAAEAAARSLQALVLPEGTDRPSAWAAAFARALSALGWPRSARLDSGEFQALQAWNETLAELGGLDAVLGPVRATTAAAHLREMLGARLFQPRGGDVRIQVMGALEAGGLAFDHLLLLGFDETLWPEPAEPNPFIPVAIQRAAGVSEASAEGRLEAARHISNRLLGSAPTVHVLWPQQIDEQPVAPSALLGPLAAESEAADPADARWAGLFAARGLERWQDVDLPVDIGSAPLAGGIGRLRDQAECPFRSAAHYGLAARAPELVPPAPDPLERGLLLHAALATLWRELRDQAGLLALDQAAREAAIARAVSAALDQLSQDMPHRFSEGVRTIEAERLPKLIEQLLAIDTQRPAFAVEMIEGASPEAIPGRSNAPVIELGGLALRVVPDRVDALDGGGRLVIDYKTGATGGLLAERLRAPQLPVYAELVEDCVGVAYGLLRAGATGYEGLLDEACPDALPGARTVEKLRKNQREAAGVENWAELRARWREQLETLAAEIRHGTASVTPLGPESCRYCDLHALCRIGDSAFDAEAATP